MSPCAYLSTIGHYKQHVVVVMLNDGQGHAGQGCSQTVVAMAVA